jgi:hypothetical protein
MVRGRQGPDPAAGLSLFAFDPGGTTGWAEFSCPFVNVFKRDTDLLLGMEVEYGQLTGLEGVQAMDVQDLLRKFVGPVIIEDFILRIQSADRDVLSPVRMTARIEQIVELTNWGRGTGDYYRLLAARQPEKGWEGTPLVHPANAWREIRVRKQAAELAMSTATDARMKDWELWATGKPHARDAMRHGITFLRRAKMDAALRRWAWPELAAIAA